LLIAKVGCSRIGTPLLRGIPPPIAKVGCSRLTVLKASDFNSGDSENKINGYENPEMG
jgi:hypothetical protein